MIRGGRRIALACADNVDAHMAMMSMTEVCEALRGGAFSCQEYNQNLIACHEANAELNPYVSYDWDRLLDEAAELDANGRPGDGLCGIALALKDNINTVRLTTSAATPVLENLAITADAPVASRLFAAGALLGAKANMHELAFGITNNNAHTGASRNPFDPAMIPGGSSGGIAVAVAAGMIPAGIGTDTGGSVRIPAALCGIAGFRPSVGRYPCEGVVPISRTRDTVGPMARCVADIRHLDAVMAQTGGSPAQLPLRQVRLGVPRGYFYDKLETGIADVMDRTLNLLAAEGAQLTEVDIPEIGDLNSAVSFTIVLFEFARDLADYLSKFGNGITVHDVCEGVSSPDVKAIVASLMGDGAVEESCYRSALDDDRPRLRQAFAACFREHNVDALIFPTVPLSARPIGDDETVELNGERVPTFPTYIRNTDPASSAGLPGISIPIGFTDSGLPIGAEIDGAFRTDEKLLSIAEAIEQTVGFSDGSSDGRASAMPTGGASVPQ